MLWQTHVTTRVHIRLDTDNGLPASYSFDGTSKNVDVKSLTTHHFFRQKRWAFSHHPLGKHFLEKMFVR
jgi:hypothetical protein